MPTLHEERIITEAVAADMGNPRFEEAACRVLIVRLSPFRDIEVSYSHLVLFDESRRAVPDAFLDFAFLPPLQDRKALATQGIPWFFGRASGRSPAEFDIVLISCSFTPELINLPWLLAQSGIPLCRAERLQRSNVPLLFLGGSSAVTAGALIKIEKGQVRESLVDALFFGEGEGRLEDIVRIAAEGLRQGTPKAAILADIASKVEGFWPCDSHFSAHRALPQQRPQMLLSPLVLNGENADHIKLAITAGCSGHCSFCLEGWDRRPFREKPLQELSGAALVLKRATGAVDVELFSYNFNMHHEILSIIPAIGRYFLHVSLMSQRLDILAEHPELLAAEFAAGKRSFTLGIEGISERLRRYYHKGISGAQIWASVSSILRQNARELKLFFIISGFEDDADLEELDSFCAEVASLKAATHSATRILVSAGYLVRLPFTPLQFAPLAPDRPVLERIASRFEAICGEHGLEFRLAVSFEDYWLDQMLSTAGPLAYEWLSACPAQAFVYDGHASRGSTRSLNDVLRKTADFPMLLAEKPADYRPCFSFVEDEDHWKLLRAHYERSAAHLRGQTRQRTSPHQRPHSPHGAMFGLDAQRALSLIAAQQEAKAHFPHILVKVIEDDALAFSTEAYECAWLLRTLSAIVSGAERALFRCSLALPNEQWAGTFPKAPLPRFGLSGEKFFLLYGPDATILRKIVAQASRALHDAPCGQLAAQHRSPEGVPGSFVLLECIEEAKALPAAETCMLLCTLCTNDERGVAHAIQTWLKAQDMHSTLRKLEDRYEYCASNHSTSRKLATYIQYNTSSSGIKVRLRVGRRADILTFADLLHKEFPTEEIIFRIEAWS
jgi:radical SAM superfamily enzyme YgiQ (UPF0313 family)